MIPGLLKTENLKVYLPYIHITCSPQVLIVERSESLRLASL